ncbi:MAG TPA: hypothetical protein VGS10_10720 [Terracidiphilus sp.]|nr:hypothetical protein [Terracidiphilus sp.]
MSEEADIPRWAGWLDEEVRGNGGGLRGNGGFSSGPCWLVAKALLKIMTKATNNALDALEDTRRGDNDFVIGGSYGTGTEVEVVFV